jgi:hypothetical protein
MKTTLFVAAVAALSLVPVGGCGDDGGGTETPDADNVPHLDCEVVIIGGGAGGLHTAFRLAPTLGDKVCLFEKEAELGGRIHDVQLDDNDPDPEANRIGTGARRIMDGQNVLFSLADELGMTYETVVAPGDFLNTRGRYAFSKEAMLPAYPTITPDVSGDTETALYDKLRFDAARANVDTYPDFRSYIRGVAGFEEFQFLHDVSRFRADFEAPLDARGYLDYLDEEWDVCCDASYPIGGMSAFIRGMEREATADGAQIFTSEPVSEVSRDGTRYKIVTSGHVVTADKVVFAVPPVALQWITGDVADDIKEQPEFQAIIGIKVVTVTEWFPTAWWEQIENPVDSSKIWRAWSNEHCFNFLEIPVDAYGIAQKAIRTVYDDDQACVEFWEDTYEAGGEAAVAAEVKRGMEHMFNNNGVSAPITITIPDPIKTHVQIWPAAWHWLRAGSQGMTNADLFDWAVAPLGSEPVGMVGEAYNVQRSGWSDAAYKSSINLLNEKYGLSLPGVARTAPRSPLVKTPWSAHRN